MNKNLIKCGVAMIAAMLAVASFAQEQESKETETMSLVEARATISDAIKDPEVMAATMEKLSPEDQVTYVAEVNAAIAKMPGSGEERTAVALNANKAALRSAAPGNVANVLAEVYATAPVESLGVISESLGSDMFNRNADPTQTYTDAQFTAIAEAVVKKVSERTANVEDGGARSAFAAMMMVNASNGSIDNLGDTLSESLPADVREVAKNEWLPAASSENKDYTDILGQTTSEPEAPKAVVVLQMAGPQMLDAMLADVAASVVSAGGDNTAATPIVDNAFGGFGENVVYVNTPTSQDASSSNEETTPSQQPADDVPYAPQPYQYND